MVKKEFTPDERMIETVIQDYLQRNPAMKREDILVQTVGGKLVIRSIKNAFSRIPKSVQEEQSASPQYPRFLQELSRNSAERLKTCQQSIQSAKLLIDWMSNPRYADFTGNIQKKILQAIRVLEPKFTQLHDTLQDVKDRFSEAINGGLRPAPDEIRQWVQEYMQILLSQLKCQRSIFINELKVGDRFAECANRFLREGIPQEYDNPNPDFVKNVVKAVLILKKNGIEMPSVSGTMDVKTFGDALMKFANRLEIRRKKLHELSRLIDYIEALIGQMKGTSNTPVLKNSSNRMAIWRITPRK